MEILIINTGVGNVESIKNILQRMSLSSKISTLDEDFKKYNKFIIPGVGNFDRAMNELKAYSSFELIKNKEFLKDKFILGICLGMHLLFEESEEGVEKGLGLFKGKVKKFGQKIGKRVAWKKAIVTLKSGDTLNFVESGGKV